MPRVLIFAGANGSGKTTFAKSVLEPDMIFINADDIKDREGLSDLDAGKKALHSIDLSIAKKTDFSFETTMSGLGLQKRFEHFKKTKYTIVIYYLFVYPAELLLERIKERLKKGGHPVADEDVLRRYKRSVQNFWNKYRFFAAEWSIINNNELEAQSIAFGNKEELRVIDDFDFEILKGVLKDA